MVTTQSESEEFANSLTHGVGVFLSFGALVWMVVGAIPQSPWHVTGVGIFGLCLIGLYLSSTIYHTVSSEIWKPLWQVIDHCFIFVLIAGSYMPWLLVNLRGPWGWTLLGVVWGLAVGGIILKTLFIHKFQVLSLVVYILMGWLICLAAGPLLENVSTAGLIWLTAGGLSYTGGVVFFVRDKMKYAHAIWHGFVLLGSACHVIAVMIAVIPHS